MDARAGPLPAPNGEWDMTQTVTTENFDGFIKDNPVALVDFTATWCGPCQMLKPIIEELANDYEGKAAVAKLDIDESREVAARYKIMSVPTVILFKNGEPAEQVIGVRSKGEFEEMLDRSIG
jgi:thioredoxin 1